MPTAWGEIIMSIGTPGAGEIMSTTLASLGSLKEDSVSIETEDGNVYQMFGTGHVLLDQLKTEPTLKVKGTLVGLSKATQFWEMDGAAPTRIKSFVCSDYFSVKMASKVVGSDTLEAPKCTVSVKPIFSEKEGWTAEFEFTILKGTAGYIFDIGTVAA